MLSDVASGCEVYLVTGYTDIRKGIDGLAAIVKANCCLIPSVKLCFCFAEETAVK